MKLRLESLEAREVLSVAPGEEGVGPDIVYEAGLVVRWSDVFRLEGDVRIEGTVEVYGGKAWVEVSPTYIGSAPPIITIAPGGKIVQKPYGLGAGNFLGNDFKLTGIPLVIEAGGELNLLRAVDGWGGYVNGAPLTTSAQGEPVPWYADMRMTTDTYIINNGSILIEDNSRLIITGAADTNCSAFPVAGLISTGDVSIHSGEAPSALTGTSNKLDLAYGWYQAGGFVTTSHMVQNRPQAQSDVYMRGSGYFRNVVWFTASPESNGTGGFVATGDLTFVSTSETAGTSFRVRNSWTEGQGIDSITAANITFVGVAPRIIMDEAGSTPQAGWRYFLLCPTGTITGFAPIFSYDPAHWMSDTTAFGGSSWGDIAYIP
jgi:hypothetical protein